VRRAPPRPCSHAPAAHCTQPPPLEPRCRAAARARARARTHALPSPLSRRRWEEDEHAAPPEEDAAEAAAARAAAAAEAQRAADRRGKEEFEARLRAKDDGRTKKHSGARLRAWRRPRAAPA
jgi:hypothetical protein